MNLEKIGTVHSCFKVKFGTPRQSQIAKLCSGFIEMDKKWEPLKSLKGLEAFSHAWVLFWFHDNNNFIYRPVVHPPRLGRKGMGAFATRSPLRPNPIGLSLVKIDRVIKERIYISGIDIIEGTPVLDIKPYINAYDSVPDSKSGWLEDLKTEDLEVKFSQEALQDLASFTHHQNLQQNIRDILSSDIRNRNDKQTKNIGKALGFYFEDLNIIFVCSGQHVEVIKVEKAKSKNNKASRDLALVDAQSQPAQPFSF